MNLDVLRLLVVVLAVAITSCSMGMRTPAHTHQFCEDGFLVLPGQVMGRVGIQIRDEVHIRPLIAGDTICLKRSPNVSDTIPELT